MLLLFFGREELLCLFADPALAEQHTLFVSPFKLYTHLLLPFK